MTQPASKRNRIPWQTRLFRLVFLAGAVALLRDTRYQGQDFEVLWRTARHVLDGAPAYDVVRDGAMTYKYPPWTITFLLPLAVLPLAAAKWVWGAVQVASIAAVWRWLRVRCGVSTRVLTVLTMAFWGVWAVHALDGQITLPMLAAALWLWSVGRGSGVLLALSTKILTLYAALGAQKTWFNPRSIAVAVLLAGALSLPVLQAHQWDAGAMIESWRTTSTSGGVLFEGEKVRGRDNQGLPALALRILDVPAKNAKSDLWAFLFFAVALGLFWRRSSRQLREEERWSGWLALSAVVHPLAWFHSFVLAFPLAALAWSRVVDANHASIHGPPAHGSSAATKRARLALLALGTLCVVGITRKTMGPVGAMLELSSIKSIGVLLLMFSLTLKARAR